MPMLSDSHHLLTVSSIVCRREVGISLEEISFTVDPCDIVAVLGANGSGKSTLVDAVSGLIPISGGRIRFDGANEHYRLEDLARLRISYLRQAGGVFPHLSVAENLQVACIGSRMGKVSRLPPVELMTMLEGKDEQIAGTLSGGEQQILALAMCLVTKPRLLVADEVLRGLSTSAVTTVLALLEREAKAGMAILVAEDRARDICRVAVRFLGLKGGRIAASGEGGLITDNILRNIYF